MAAHEMSGQVFAIIKLDLPVVIMVLEDFLWEQYCQSWTRMLQAFGLFQVRCHSESWRHMGFSRFVSLLGEEEAHGFLHSSVKCWCIGAWFSHGKINWVMAVCHHLIGWHVSMVWYLMTRIESKRQYKQWVCTGETIQKQGGWAAQKQQQWRTKDRW